MKRLSQEKMVDIVENEPTVYTAYRSSSMSKEEKADADVILLNPHFQRIVLQSYILDALYPDLKNLYLLLG